jgi:hypothetical protein
MWTSRLGGPLPWWRSGAGRWIIELIFDRCDPPLRMNCHDWAKPSKGDRRGAGDIKFRKDGFVTNLTSQYESLSASASEMKQWQAVTEFSNFGFKERNAPLAEPIQLTLLMNETQTLRRHSLPIVEIAPLRWHRKEQLRIVLRPLVFRTSRAVVTWHCFRGSISLTYHGY